MRFRIDTKTHARTALLGVVAAALFAAIAPAANAQFGVTENHWEAGTCEARGCVYTSPRSDFYTQAAGHPEWGITSFELNSKAVGLGREPEGALKRLRVDVPAGLAANPQALPKCPIATFEEDKCPETTKVGETELTVFVLALDTEVSGTVYNLEPAPGLPLEFGIHVEVPAVSNEHIFLEGHVDWSGDYHEWFEINNISKSIPILKSKLLFKGRAGQGNFLTLPSVCSSTTTSYLEVESYEGAIARTETHTPVGVEGCGSVPFKPTVTVSPGNSGSDQPDGTTTVVTVPQNTAANQINTADVQDARVTLPEGLTLNPAAAHGLAACTPEQIGIGTTNKVSCPEGSRIGTVAIETDLPPGSLTGPVFLGGPAGKPIESPPYTIYLDAESSLGVSVRLQGTVTPNASTGRLEVSFANNPPLPFSELRLGLNGGERAPLANPLSCGGALTEFAFTAYTGGAANGSSPFQTTGCPSPLPFSIGQGTSDGSPNAGASTPSFTFNLTRSQGQQYLERLTTTLPAGLVGTIPTVPLCAEAQIQSNSCPATSQIGTATAGAGSGEAYSFSGPVFLTGPTNGAPYGLFIPIQAEAGPFNLGTISTRVAIGVDPHSARVIAATTLPTIWKGVPLRLRTIGVTVNHPNFLLNPTYCGPLATESSLVSTSGTGASVSSPFSVGNCSALPFKPTLEAATSASTNPTTLKANGASLSVNLLQGAHEANIRSVVASLPKQLPSRLTTLQKACPEATYAANPFGCPPGSKVGTATVTTPVLPGKLTGPAYLVSHGGAAFPDLDLLLEGDGVRVILVGNTQIKSGITTSTFASVPDVPVSSFVLSLPQGANSAVTATGGPLCTQALTMPTVITAQSGAQLKLNTPIAVAGCTGGKGKARIKILSKRIAHNKLVLRVQTFAAGRVSVKNRLLRTTYKRFAKPGKFTIKVPLSRKGVSARAAHRLRFKARVGFLPKSKAEAVSVAFTSIGFPHKAKGKSHKR